MLLNFLRNDIKVSLVNPSPVCDSWAKVTCWQTPGNYEPHSSSTVLIMIDVMALLSLESKIINQTAEKQ